MYEATQTQRNVERSIRKQKNRILVSEAAGDKEKLLIDQIRLRRLNDEYSRFSKASGLPTQRERMQVAGFGRGQAARANGAYNAELKKRNYFESKFSIANPDILKYTENEKWEIFKKCTSYIEEHPNTTIDHYVLYDALKSKSLIKGQIVSYQRNHANVLADLSSKKEPNHIMTRMMERSISSEEVQSFVDNALFCESQFKGTRLVYYANDGVTVLSKTTDYAGIDWIAKTVWAKVDFDEKILEILEVAKQYGFGK